MNKYLEHDKINDKIQDQLINICVQYDFPILLGKQFANFVENKVKFTQETYVKFYMNLDRVKSLKSDAIKFVQKC